MKNFEEFNWFKKEKEKKKLNLDFQKDNSIEDPYGEEAWDRSGIFDQIVIKKEIINGIDVYYILISNNKYIRIGWKEDLRLPEFRFSSHMFYNNYIDYLKHLIERKKNLIDITEDNLQDIKNTFFRADERHEIKYGIINIPNPGDRIIENIRKITELL
jgi:hypothetical protein